MTTENESQTDHLRSQVDKLDSAMLAVDGLRSLGENAVTQVLNTVDDAPKTPEGTVLGRLNIAISLALEGLEVVTPVIAGNKGETVVQGIGMLASLIGGGAGSLVGGKALAAGGAVLGSPFGPKGTIAGSIAGGIVGGTGGYFLGSQTLEAWAEDKARSYFESLEPVSILSAVPPNALDNVNLYSGPLGRGSVTVSSNVSYASTGIIRLIRTPAVA